MTTGETGSAPLDEALVNDLIERLRAYFNAHDPAFITELMAEDIVFDHPLAPATLHGRAALQAFYTGSIWKAMPDAAVELAAGPASCGCATQMSSVASMEPSERKALDLVVQRLLRKFPDVSSQAIHQAMDGAYAEFHRSRVRTYLPILVEREVTERLGRQTVAP